MRRSVTSWGPPRIERDRRRAARRPIRSAVARRGQGNPQGAEGRRPSSFDPRRRCRPSKGRHAGEHRAGCPVRRMLPSTTQARRRKTTEHMPPGSAEFRAELGGAGRVVRRPRLRARRGRYASGGALPRRERLRAPLGKWWPEAGGGVEHPGKRRSAPPAHASRELPHAQGNCRRRRSIVVAERLSRP